MSRLISTVGFYLLVLLIIVIAVFPFYYADHHELQNWNGAISGRFLAAIVFAQ